MPDNNRVSLLGQELPVSVCQRCVRGIVQTHLGDGLNNGLSRLVPRELLSRYLGLEECIVLVVAVVLVDRPHLIAHLIEVGHPFRTTRPPVCSYPSIPLLHGQR